MRETGIMATMLALIATTCVGGCQSAPPMPNSTFQAAAKKCGLQATTYVYRDGILLDEPLVDFGKEGNPAKAHVCFNAALDALDREATARGATYISYIWEWKA